MYRKFLFVLFAVVAAATALLMTSCSPNSVPAAPAISEIDGSNWYQSRDEAFATIDEARKAFFKGIPSSRDLRANLKPKSLQELAPPPPAGDSVDWSKAVIDSSQDSIGEPDSMQLQEKIVTAALASYTTGDTTILINFLAQNNLLDKYYQIIQQYNLEAQAKTIASKPRSKSVTSDQLRSPTFIAGDIFLCYKNGSGSSSSDGNSSSGDNSSSVSGMGLLIPGKWKHAGFLDGLQKNRTDGYAILSASAQTDRGFCVGYETYKKWTQENAVSAYRVNGTNPTIGQNAINYSIQFLGKPFSFLTNGMGWGTVELILKNTLPFTTAGINATPRMANDYFYCSKTVYRGWLSQGHELEPHYDSYNGDPWKKELQFWRWTCGAKVFGVCVSTYPEFHWVEIPDDFITPTDISNSNQVSWIGLDPK